MQCMAILLMKLDDKVVVHGFLFGKAELCV